MHNVLSCNHRMFYFHCSGSNSQHLFQLLCTAKREESLQLCVVGTEKVLQKLNTRKAPQNKLSTNLQFSSCEDFHLATEQHRSLCMSLNVHMQHAPLLSVYFYNIVCHCWRGHQNQNKD